MSLKYKIILPLVIAFLFAVVVTGFLSIDGAAKTVESSFLRELRTTRGFLTRMRPPLSPESLRRMKDLFRADLAVVEGLSRVRESTLHGKGARALEEALARGGLEGVIRGGDGSTGEGGGFRVLRLGGKGYRVLGGRLEGPPSPGGEPSHILILLEEGRIAEAKRRAILPVVGASALGILVVLVAGWWVASSFTRRLKGLSEATERIAAGEEGSRVEAGGGDELGRFAGAFNRMVDAVAESRDRLVHSERMAALGKLASAMAHEVRNPLTSIRMTAEILRPDLEEGKSREALDMLLRELKRLELFLEEILTLSGGIALKVEATDVGDLTGEVLALLKERLIHMGIETESEVPPGLRFPLDGDRVKQVLVNLILNGAAEAGSGGSVRVRARKTEDGGLRIDVLDTGAGVDPDAAGRIFEPFFTTRPGGTGLGLAVSRRIAVAHGGRIAHRREGDRTVFSLELPGEPAR